jgi:hypothetical protein
MISCKGEQSSGTPSRPVAAASSDCDAQRQIAIADFNSKNAKYYFHGIAYPSKEVVEKLQAAHVTVVVNGCMQEKEASCYNYFVDSLLNGR